MKPRAIPIRILKVLLALAVVALLGAYLASQRRRVVAVVHVDQKAYDRKYNVSTNPFPEMYFIFHPVDLTGTRHFQEGCAQCFRDAQLSRAGLPVLIHWEERGNGNFAMSVRRKYGTPQAVDCLIKAFNATATKMSLKGMVTITPETTEGR